MEAVVKTFWEDDEKFFALLDQGLFWQEVIATMLRAEGYEVESSTYEHLPTIEERQAKYSPDDKDLVIRAKSGRDIIVEVKSRDYTFWSEPDSFPFKTIFVEGAWGFDKKTVKPEVYLNISQRTHRILALNVEKTRRFWTLGETVRDRVRDIDVTNYECPKEHLRTWKAFLKWLEEQ